MKKTLILFIIFSFASMANTAFAHTGMEQSSLLHNVLHISAAVGIYLAMMATGFYLLRKLPKAQRIRIRK